MTKWQGVSQDGKEYARERLHGSETCRLVAGRHRDGDGSGGRNGGGGGIRYLPPRPPLDRSEVSSRSTHKI